MDINYQIQYLSDKAFHDILGLMCISDDLQPFVKKIIVQAVDESYRDGMQHVKEEIQQALDDCCNIKRGSYGRTG